MYALVNNQTIEHYPYSISRLRKDNPNTTFPRRPDPELLAQWNVHPVQPTDRPAYGITKNTTEGTPYYEDGVWKQVWNVTDATPEEIEQRLQSKREHIAVSRFQAFAALDEFDLLDATESIISSEHFPTRCRLAWKNATEFRRLSPTVLQVAAELELSDEQLDELFAFAETVEA